MKYKILLIAGDFVLLAGSFILASVWAPVQWHNGMFAYLCLVVVRTAFFYHYGLYSAILRFAGFPLAVAISKAVTLSSLALVLPLHLRFIGAPSINFYVMEYVFALLLISASRFLPRFIEEIQTHSGRKNILIYGAGSLGEGVVRNLLKHHDEYRIVGFLDDKASKVAQRIHNVPVLGSINQLKGIVEHKSIAEVIIAISGISGENVRKITRECYKSGVACRIVPDFADILYKDINIKDVDIADLLKRQPHDLDVQQIERFLTRKVILITGAAGSIGSELVRQCLRFKPRRLLLLDNSEYGLYQLIEELESGPVHDRTFSRDVFSTFLVDLTDKAEIEFLIESERPEIIFHAAAYKHVPILEENPSAAVRNNVEGTIHLAEVAHRYEVDKFILISSDKAVRPTSLMGATKRICELYIQNLSLRSKTEYVAVRFGNVLGSSGSVIPKFIQQINQGGPVTVTHPNVTRYFMLTEEAVLLVMQAASIGNGGEIFILNMGKPINIREMAEDLIFLSGKRPNQDIEIKIVGLRPGEKLYEELLIDEMEKKTHYENITIGKTTVIDWAELKMKINQLIHSAQEHRKNDILAAIHNIVPEYHSNDLIPREDAGARLLPFSANKS